MTSGTVATVAFNRGLISRLALARTDIAKVPLSAAVMKNWLPLSLGSMTLRPGLAFISSIPSACIHIPFIFSTSDTAIIECSDHTVRVLIDEHPIERVDVATTITNGTFATNVDGWTDADELGATSTWGSPGPGMVLIGTGFSSAIRRQQLSIGPSDIGVEHGLRITIANNPVTLKIGTTAGADNLVGETSLGPGDHSVAFTPTTDTAWVQFSNMAQPAAWVKSAQIEIAGPVTIASPWGSANLQNIRYTQSGDIVFVACDGVQPHKIERHRTRSWSVTQYLPLDGPIGLINTGTTTITASAKDGTITLTASHPLFKPGHVGGVWKITSVGQSVTSIFTGDGQWSDPIKVTGREGARAVTVSRAGLAGTGSAVTLQRSIGAPGSWTGVVRYTTDGGTTYNDQLDDSVIYYRIGTQAGDYSSGAPVATLDYSSGGITGTARITGVTSPTSAFADVLTSLGSLFPTATWYEGAWSDLRGWPSALAFYEGRLWWAGKDKIWGSVSDAFDSFDTSVVGDSGPISRSIGSGPVDFINWLLPLQRLLIGGQGSEISVRSTTFDEPLTPTNFNLKEATTRGSSNVTPAKIDSRGIFVSRSGERLLEITYDFPSNDYTVRDLTILVPDLFRDNKIVEILVQREPDTRVHCVREDGTAAIVIIDPVEDLLCWIEVETDGLIERGGVCLPNNGIDNVYYAVRRGSAQNLERWAHERECVPGPIVKLADSHVIYDGDPTTTIDGLFHLENRDVVCWADGKDRGAFTVRNGSITLSVAVSKACVGLGYIAQRQSTKLAYAASGGTALVKPKRVDHLGLMMDRTHARGLKFGPDFDHLDPLPPIEDARHVAPTETWDMYDKNVISFHGYWDTDSRVCLQAAAPLPVTVLGMTISITTIG